MSSQELTVFGSEEFSDIAALTGVYHKETAILPAVKINRDAETEAGKRIPAGTYSVTQDDKILYGLPAFFRPYINTFQYMEYSPATEKFVNKSIYIKSFNEEAHDELGGLRCGKVSKDALEQLSKEDQLNQRAIKCYRVLFGTIGFSSAVDADGNSYEDVEPIPCMWRMAGVNFNAPDVAIKSILKSRHHIFQHNFILNTKRDKKGSNVYYHSLVEADLANTLEFGQTEMDNFKEFQAHIDRENHFVLLRWQQAKKESFVDNADVMAELELNDSLEDL